LIQVVDAILMAVEVAAAVEDEDGDGDGKVMVGLINSVATP
jgi:hypothetical protein